MSEPVMKCSPETLYSWVGKREYPTCYMTPNQKAPPYQWKIGDESIVSRGEDNYFHSKKVGETTLTAISDDGQYQATCRYIVEDSSNITITKIQLYLGDGTLSDLGEYYLGYNDSVTIAARLFSPQDDDVLKSQVSWSSSDTNIAVVESADPPGQLGSYCRGKITAKNISGVVTIRATSVTTPDVYTDFKVTVQEGVVHVKQVQIQPRSLEIAWGQKVQISAKIFPENATNKKVRWSVPIGAVTSVKDGLVTGVSRGSSRIIVKTEDSGAQDYITVKVVDSINPISKLETDYTCYRFQMSTNTNSVSATSTVFVPTAPGQKASEVGLNVSVKDKSIIEVREIKAPSENSNKRVIYWNCLKPGYTTATITSKTDSTKTTTVEIMVLKNGASFDIYIPKTTLVTPDSIEVERGQVFTMWARGFGGEHYNYFKGYTTATLGNSTFWNVDWVSNWEFTPNCTQLEPIRISEDTCQSYAIFRAGYIPGDYEIRVSRKNPDVRGYDWPERIIKVKIVDKLYTDPYIELIPKKYYLCFKSEDKLSDSDHIKCYTNNPAEFYIGWIKTAGSTTEYPTLFKADEFGWKIAHDGIISKIETDGKYFKIYRGPNYGVTQLTFYLKANPHVQYSCFVEYDGGDWRYYTTDKNIVIDSDSSDTGGGGSSDITPSIKPTSAAAIIPVSSDTTNTNTSTTPGENIIVTGTVTYRTGGYNSKYNYNSDTGLADSYIEPKVKRKISSGTSNYRDPGFPKNGSSSS